MPERNASRETWVTLGRVSGMYGIQGWVRIYSWTEPRGGILDYPRWWLGAGEARREHALIEGRVHGRGVVARLAGIEDRTAARSLLGAEIAVPRSALVLGEGYYWADLIGLAVENRDGVTLGRVSGHIETGGHDVMIITEGTRERLIPWAPGVYVDKVLFGKERITVDWNPED
ncbi:MAG: ribosome maturation factor RimM [Gammaproteobacteria bacterium]